MTSLLFELVLLLIFGFAVDWIVSIDKMKKRKEKNGEGVIVMPVLEINLCLGSIKKKKKILMIYYVHFSLFATSDFQNTDAKV